MSRKILGGLLGNGVVYFDLDVCVVLAGSQADDVKISIDGEMFGEDPVLWSKVLLGGDQVDILAWTHGVSSTEKVNAGAVGG